MSVPVLPFLRLEKTGSVLVDIHVMPNASKTRAEGLYDGALRVRLKAPPVEGKANQALIAWLAKQLKVPRTSIELARGQSARRKQLRVSQSGVDTADWSQLNAADYKPSAFTSTV